MELQKIAAYLVFVIIPAFLIVNYELGACWTGVDTSSKEFLKSKHKLRMVFSMREPYLSKRRSYDWPYPGVRSSKGIFGSSIMVCLIFLLIILYSGLLSSIPSNTLDIAVLVYCTSAFILSGARAYSPSKVLPPFWTKKIKVKKITKA